MNVSSFIHLQFKGPFVLYTVHYITHTLYIAIIEQHFVFKLCTYYYPTFKPCNINIESKRKDIGHL